ncbi:MucBP domain-containing protein [Lactococcus petauri]|uniref:MucBP domain-containing protein n=1 Tax=Lactococcus petauri TaxID=1940789 RepID=UPI00254CADB2|nr:MucBP domain-containing protein [Lactococcus petauri]
MKKIQLVSKASLITLLATSSLLPVLSNTVRAETEDSLVSSEVIGNGEIQRTESTDGLEVLNPSEKIEGIPGKTTIKYIDTEGNPLRKDVVITNSSSSLGEPYECIPLTFEGYNLKESSNAKGTITEDDVTVIFIYSKNEVVPGKTTIKYIDTEGNPLRKDIVITNDSKHLGDPYKCYPWTFEGYTLKESHNAEGTITEDDVTVIFVYSKDQDLAHVTVHDSTLKVGDNWSPEDNFDEATDFSGNIEEFSDIIVDGVVDTTKPGTYEVTYSIPEEHWEKSNTVEGHHSATATITVAEKDSETDGSGSGSNNSGNNTDSSTEEDLTDSDTVLTNSQNGQDTSNQINNPVELDSEQGTPVNKSLPQTGERFSFITLMIGMTLLIGSSVFAMFHFKKSK